MNIQRILTPPEGNPRYPLPLDYDSYTSDGRRKARVNACRQWLLPGQSDFDKAESRVASLRFFDQYYLHPDPSSGFDPLFYDEAPLPSPAMHWDMVRAWATMRMNLDIWPRGAAKSTVMRKDIGLCTISRPGYSTTYATSTHENAKQTGQILKDLCYYNERINDDWAPEYEGRIKPLHGQSPTGTELFYLNNGSWVRCISASSRQRGMRPRRYRLDDPEYDPKASTSLSILREYMQVLLFKVVLPMVMRGECGVDWTATFVSKRHYAFHAMETVLAPEGETAKDPRFNFWSRRLVRAAYEIDGALVSCWPQMWPVDRAAKLADPSLAKRISLEEIRDTIGIPNFNSEYLANPGEGESHYFGALTKEKHRYWFDGLIDDKTYEDPRRSSTLLCWVHKGILKSEPLSEFCAARRLFMVCDTSFTAKSDSDYKVAMVLCIDYTTNELFVLDSWAGQTNEEVLVQKTLGLADRWRVPSIHPELVRESASLYDNLESKIKTRASNEFGYAHIPTLMRDNKPGSTNKEAKIASLLFRFEHGLVKLPTGRGEPWWTELESQIEEYNPEVLGGGLPHDDLIDCLGMSRQIVRGRFSQAPLPEEEPIRPFINQLLDGETHVAGAPIGMGIDWTRIPPETVEALFKLRADKETHSGRTRA